MKKTLLTVLIGLTLTATQAQHSQMPANNKGGIKLNKSINPEKVHGKTRATGERWYMYGDAMDQYVQTYMLDSSTLYANNLFPDSTILVDYGTSGYAGTWIHLLGDVLDVTSTIFNDPIFSGELNIPRNNHSIYSVDSADMYFIYQRGLNNPAIDDTLVFEYTVVPRPTNSFPYFNAASPVSANLGTDTVMFVGLSYSFANNNFNSTTKKTHKQVLTAASLADTLANGFSYIKFPLDNIQNINPSSMLAMTVKFIPGYTWVPNMDTITSKNRVLFISYKELEGSFPIYNKRDWNVSYIVPQDVRYNNAGGWNGDFIPSFAYMGSTPTYNYEHHMIGYKVRSTNVGMDEVPNVITASVVPNPSNGAARISLNLTKAERVSVTVHDVTGRVVLTPENRNLLSGDNLIDMDLTSLRDGIYTLQVTAESGQQTHRLVISR